MQKKKQSRSSPNSKSFQTVKGYPKSLVLYKLGTSDIWHKRFYYQGRYYRETTNTKDLDDAKDQLVEFHRQVIDQEHQSSKSVNSFYSFKRIGDKFLIYQEKLIQRGERNKRINLNEKSYLNKHIDPHFKGKSIKSITRSDLEDFFVELSKKNLKNTSQKKILNFISKIFKYAFENDVIDKVPYFPKISQIDSPRPTFSIQQYTKLKNVADEMIKDDVKIRGNTFTKELKFVIQFMMNSFIRPSDLKHLRHRNIEISKIFDDREKRDTLEISYEQGKTKSLKTTFTMTDCVGIYKDLIKFHQLNENPCSRDDYLFLPKITNRDYAFRTIQRLFNELLNRCELKKSSRNENHSLYSLRHTAISFRVYDGVDINIIARNANTSTDMINRFYASHILNKISAKEIQLKHRQTKTGYN